MQLYNIFPPPTVFFFTSTQAAIRQVP